METLDFVDLSRQMADLARGAEEQASRPQVSARERRLLKRQVRAAAESSALFARCAAARSDRELAPLLKRVQKHQTRIIDAADRLLATTGGL